jgi:hypothetical protein
MKYSGRKRGYNRRRWNNYLILAVLVFIAVLNMPTLIKTYLITPKPAAENPSLLNPHLDITAIHTEQWSLTQKDGQWHVSVPLNISAQTLVKHWQNLVGTKVDEAMYHSLIPKLKLPGTVEIWYKNQEEPQRVTYYKFPQFWLLKNWQNQWIAVSVERDYLFPAFSETGAAISH